MPEIMRLSEPVEEIFLRKARERGLDPDAMPVAVTLGGHMLNSGLSVLHQVISDLPSELRAWEWLEVMMASYAEFFAATMVIDTPPGADSSE